MNNKLPFACFLALGKPRRAGSFNFQPGIRSWRKRAGVVVRDGSRDISKMTDPVVSPNKSKIHSETLGNLDVGRDGSS